MPIHRLSSGGIIANYQCPAACGHCLYGCSPSAQPGFIDEAAAENVCETLRHMDCRSLHIGGGEPFLDVAGLVGLVKVIRGSGIKLDYIETNAAWITHDDAHNRRVLREVVNAGGDCIMVSADPFHIEFIPFWKPQKLLELMCGMGISHFVWQERYWPLLARLNPEMTYDGQALCDFFGCDLQQKCAAEYGMRFGGRALNLLRKHGTKKAITVLQAPCAELQNTSHFHVDFMGHYIPPGCTGMGILLEDLGEALDPAKYPVLSRLMEQGLDGLLQYAQDLGFVLDENGYVSKCELCFALRKYLVRHNTPTPDLTPASFYQQDF